ncbi:MAG: signal peptidase I [Rickettsiales bacterium]|nr:MAG: signal peptidase I [Rickettsiales bacterium]
MNKNKVFAKLYSYCKAVFVWILLDSKPENRTTKKTIKDLLIALVIATLIRSFFYEPFYIPSGSMKPGLLEGDFILVSKYDFGYTKYSFPFAMIPFDGRVGFDAKKLERGDVLVFRVPSDPTINYIKRLIGLPDDKVQVKDGVLYINDAPVSKDYAGEFIETEGQSLVKGFEENIEDKKFIVLDSATTDADNTPIFYVPKQHYFFMGDNRDNSLDSRFIQTGFIPEENLIGKARVIFFSKWGTIFKFWNSIRFSRFFKVIK